MKENTLAFACGLLFALGLGLSGMVQPLKVLAFLDLYGDWDPSLAFVMVGAMVVYFVGFRLCLKREKPHQAVRFVLPVKKSIDFALVAGAILFGIGWGLGGLCPGPALVALPTGLSGIALFVATMAFGMRISRFF